MIEVISLKGEQLLDSLPPYYAEIMEFRQLAQSEGEEFDSIANASDMVMQQHFIDTATWGLSKWEKELGIKPVAGQPFDQRRSVIRSKLRGTGTVTISLIKSVAEAYDGGTVDVTVDPAVYAITIQFVDTTGIPPNLDDLMAALEEIKPAHLELRYEFSYLLINEIHNAMTLAELETVPLNKFAGGA